MHSEPVVDQILSKRHSHHPDAYDNGKLFAQGGDKGTPTQLIVAMMADSGSKWSVSVEPVMLMLSESPRRIFVLRASSIVVPDVSSDRFSAYLLLLMAMTTRCA
jgi:hypothetical protein